VVAGCALDTAGSCPPRDKTRENAGDEGLELLALDRLALEQDLGDRLERVPAVEQDVRGVLVSALDDATDLVAVIGVIGLSRAGYNAIAIPLAAGVLAPVGFVLPPAFGAILMSISTIVVAINAQLLRRLDPRPA